MDQAEHPVRDPASTQISSSNKRKRGPTIHDPNKRQHVAAKPSSPPHTLPTTPLDALLTELRPKYDLVTLSVLSSSKIEKRISRVLSHLGRFHPTDLAVLPGVIFLHAKANVIGKLLAVVELAKRRIHEDGQKWYQYNGMYEVEAEVKEMPSVIEETVMNGTYGGSHEEDAEDEVDDFETMPQQFQRAIAEPTKMATVNKLYMSIFLSRVPLVELKTRAAFTLQTNESLIDAEQRRRIGLS